jgi:hypothetical protein
MAFVKFIVTVENSFQNINSITDVEIKRKVIVDLNIFSK